MGNHGEPSWLCKLIAVSIQSLISQIPPVSQKTSTSLLESSLEFVYPCALWECVQSNAVVDVQCFYVYFKLSVNRVHVWQKIPKSPDAALLSCGELEWEWTGEIRKIWCYWDSGSPAQGVWCPSITIDWSTDLVHSNQLTNQSKLSKDCRRHQSDPKNTRQYKILTVVKFDSYNIRPYSPKPHHENPQLQKTIFAIYLQSFHRKGRREQIWNKQKVY